VRQERREVPSLRRHVHPSKRKKTFKYRQKSKKKGMASIPASAKAARKKWTPTHHARKKSTTVFFEVGKATQAKKQTDHNDLTWPEDYEKEKPLVRIKNKERM